MDKTAYLCFLRGTREYALENHQVQRIVKACPLTPILFADKRFKGLMVLDDKIVAVADIEESNREVQYYIYVLFKGEAIGICADELSGIVKIPDTVWEVSDNPYASYMYKNGDKTLYLLTP